LLMKMKLSIFLPVYLHKRTTHTRINKNHQECESNFKHQCDGQETFLLYIYTKYGKRHYMLV
jgi:hypothetical protein